MFRGRWNILTSVVGLIILSVLGYQSYQFYQAAEQQRGGYKYQPARAPGFRIGMPSQAPTPYYKPNCNNPYEREDADLCAQWAAVDQVSEANRLAMLNVRLLAITFFLTALGTGALLWTLRETRMVSRRELRAYVNVDMSSISDGTHHPDRGIPLGIVSGGWAIKNTGQTPAYNVRHWGEIEIAKMGEQNKLVPPRGLAKSHVATLPRDGFMTKFMKARKPTKREIAAIQINTTAVFIFGRIEYDDVFGDEHFTEYRLHFSGLWPPPENNLLFFSEQGNVAN